MKIIWQIIDFYIEASIHVAFSVVALFFISAISLNIPYDYNGAFFVFFSTIFGYNFVKYDELARVKKVVLTNKFKAIIILSFFSALAAFYFFTKLSFYIQFVALLAFVLTVLYTLPFLPKHKNLRNFSGIKIYIVALAWTVVTVLLPVISDTVHFGSLFFLLMQRFIFVFVLLLVFEINDLNNDAVYLQTIPQKIGVTKTKKLAYFLSILFFVLEYFINQIISISFFVLMLITFLLLLFTYFSSEKRNKYYTSFWVEALPVFWLFVLFCFLK